MGNNLSDKLDDFLSTTKARPTSADGKEEEVCDLQTGECYTIRTKDGIVERINKTYIIAAPKIVL